MYGHHHTGLGAMLLLIGALFTRVVRFLVHHSEVNHIPGWDHLHHLLHKLTRQHPGFRDFAENMREVLHHLRRRS